jgi:DNA-binding NtrC family response regulator
VLAGGEVIDVPNLPAPLRAAPPLADAAPHEPSLSLKEAVARLERQMILNALARTGGNRSEAARQLGIGRPQLYAKMEEYGIDDKGGEGKR